MDAKLIAHQLSIILNDPSINELSDVSSNSHQEWDSLAQIGFLTRLEILAPGNPEILTAIADVYNLQEIIKIVSNYPER